MSGTFIVIEGMDGSGKTTQARLLHELLSEKYGDKVHYFREPGATLLGENIRSLVLRPDMKGSICTRAEAMLFYAARAQLVEEKIGPALDRGEHVICDRWELSTFVYQGAIMTGGGLDDSDIASISDAANLPDVDLLIYLDIDPQQAAERVHERAEGDRIEQALAGRMEQLAAAYVTAFGETVEAGWWGRDCVTLTVDAAQSVEEVGVQIASHPHIRELLRE